MFKSWHSQVTRKNAVTLCFGTVTLIERLNGADKISKFSKARVVTTEAGGKVGRSPREKFYGNACFTYKRIISFNYSTLHILRSCGTSDNFDQLARDDCLSRSVVENLEAGDHVSSVLGSVLNACQLCSLFLVRVRIELTSMALRRAEISHA